MAVKWPISAIPIPQQAAADLVRRESLLRREGLVGQEAGPPGLGAEPALTHEPGGDIVRDLQHPAFTTIERLFRKLPEGAWFAPGVSPTNPVQFEVGSFTVPPNQAFWLFDYQFTVMRPSGIDPFDWQAAAPGRFGGFMGFDLTVDGIRSSDLAYELNPSAVAPVRTAFFPPVSDPRLAPPEEFNLAQTNAFASTASAGTSLLPVRPNVQGARGEPFTIIVNAGGVVSLSCVIFRPISSPLSAVQGRVAGYLIHEQTSSALVQRLRPR